MRLSPWSCNKCSPEYRGPLTPRCKDFSLKASGTKLLRITHSSGGLNPDLDKQVARLKSLRRWNSEIWYCSTLCVWVIMVGGPLGWIPTVCIWILVDFCRSCRGSSATISKHDCWQIFLNYIQIGRFSSSSSYFPVVFTVLWCVRRAKKWNLY